MALILIYYFLFIVFTLAFTIVVYKFLEVFISIISYIINSMIRS